MMKLLYACLVLGLLTACAPVHRADNSKKYYEPREKHISGHLYRNGRHVHHHPERHRPEQEESTPEHKESAE